MERVKGIRSLGKGRVDESKIHPQGRSDGRRCVNRTERILMAAYIRQTISDLERVKGIEPSSQAWEAHILPLNHTRQISNPTS